MNPEILTAFAAGAATASLSGGLVATWTANRLISKARNRFETGEYQAASDRDPATGLYNWKGFTAAVEDLTVTAAAASQTNRLLVIKTNGFEEVEDTYGPYAASLARDAFAEGLRRLAGPNGIPASLGEGVFALLADEASVEFIDEHGLAVEVLLVEAPEAGEEWDPGLHRSGDDYYFIAGPDEDAECGLEVYDRVRCASTVAWRWFEAADDVEAELRMLKSALWGALRGGDDMPLFLVVEDEEAEVPA